eukprot:TRINITY_DN22203_c0_g1_i1.p1 TRINITY_DN22203_c0_g1~~TRINITY_DN22203_c0_g1_i1.p1  ORF type:complete len:625 (-),score=107.21 TRINITY_DN22203_c0_g1_i1:202-2076(-)
MGHGASSKTGVDRVVSVVERGSQSPGGSDGTHSAPVWSNNRSVLFGKKNSRPIKNWLSWVKGNAEIASFRRTVDWLHVLASPSTSLETYVRTIIDEVMYALDADRCSVFFVNAVREEVWCVGSVDLEPFSMPWDKGVVGAVAHGGQMLNLPDAHQHESFDNSIEQISGYVVKSLVSIPVKSVLSPESTIGVIQVLNKRGGPTAAFSEEDEIKLQKVAMVVADSFYRQRWTALEHVLAEHDAEVQSVLEQHRERVPTANLEESAKIARSPEIMASLTLSAPAAEPLPALELCKLEFNALDYSSELLVAEVPAILQHAGCMQSCGIDSECLYEWVQAVRNGYRQNPFHNFFHAFSVYQMCFFQLSNLDVFSSLSSTQALGLLVAALCHDIDHPGVSNSFLIKTQGELAMRYNDVAVLENHHASVTCQILRREETAIAQSLSKIDKVILRQSIIKCILSTDMSQHMQICRRVSSCTSVLEFQEKDQHSLMEFCIHAADLSGQVLPWTAASEWEYRISQEFHAQATLEIQEGHNPEPFMQFNLDDLHQRGKLQRDFIDFVLVPLWEPYGQLSPAMKPCLDNLIRNRQGYENRRVYGCDQCSPEEQDNRQTSAGGVDLPTIVERRDSEA